LLKKSYFEKSIPKCMSFISKIICQKSCSENLIPKNLKTYFQRKIWRVREDIVDVQAVKEEQ